ncbi:MAG: hypothetical protein ABL995_13220 [Bryobacteraceae bacterium]
MSVDQLVATPRAWWGAARVRWDVPGLLSKGTLAAIDQALISVSNFAVGMVLARYVAAQDYAVYVLAFSAFLFLAGFHNSFVLEPMSVVGPASYRHMLPGYFGRVIALQTVATVAIAVLAVFLQLLLPQGTGVSADVLYGAGCAFPCVLLFWTMRRAAYIEGKYVHATLAALIYNVVLVISLVAVYQAGSLTPSTAFLMQALAGLFASLYLWFRLGVDFRADADAPSIRQISEQHCSYGRWASATAIVHWLSGEAYYVAVAVALRLEDVAALRAVQNVGAPFAQFVTAMGLLFLPRTAVAFADYGTRGVSAIVKTLVALFAAGAVVYMLFICIWGGSVLRLLYAGKYQAYEYLLPYVMLYVVLTAATQGILLGLRAMQSLSDVFVCYCAAAGTTLAAGIGLASLWKLPGAIAGLLCTSAVFTVVALVRYRSRIRSTNSNA